MYPKIYSVVAKWERTIDISSFELPLPLHTTFFRCCDRCIIELASISPAVNCGSIFQESSLIFHILDLHPSYLFNIRSNHKNICNLNIVQYYIYSICYYILYYYIILLYYINTIYSCTYVIHVPVLCTHLLNIPSSYTNCNCVKEE